MTTIYLIRHGQASLGKSNYDELSELGHQQATHLGRYFSDLDIIPSRIIQGDLKRHQQTSAGILKGLAQETPSRDSGTEGIQTETDARWNEFEFEAIIRLYVQQHQIDLKDLSSPGHFFGLLKRALIAWSSNELDGELPETWEAFEQRVKQALQSVLEINDENVFLVSSGGAISMAVKHILNLDNQSMIDLNLQSRNSGVTELINTRGKVYLSAFNHVSHLSSAEKKSMITHA